MKRMAWLVSLCEKASCSGLMSMVKLTVEQGSSLSGE